MANDTTSILCPNCGGTMRFDPTIGKLRCMFCDSIFSREECENYYKLQEAEDNAKTIGVDWGEDAKKMRAYSCSSCGGQIIAEETTGITRCPYCNNTAVIQANFSGAARPDYIIPFEFTKEQILEKYAEAVRKTPYMPGKFRKKSVIEDIQGVYVPFWLYDGTLYVDRIYEGQDAYETPKGTVYHKYAYEVKGSRGFKNVPADASKRMPDKIMDPLEPYDAEKMVPFNLMYLPGFMAERFDVTQEEDVKRVEDRIMRSIEDEETNKDKKPKWDQPLGVKGSRTKDDYFIHYSEKKYVLLPVWYLVVNSGKENYVFALNGQTGKFAGKLPFSIPKFILLILISLILFCFGQIGVFVGATNIIFGLLAAIVPRWTYGIQRFASDYMDKSFHLISSEPLESPPPGNEP